MIGPLHRPVYDSTHNTNKRQTFMSPVGFELAIPASERPQTLSSERAATVIDLKTTKNGVRKLVVDASAT